MSKNLAAFGCFLAFAALILSVTGFRHIVIFGVPVGISILFWFGYLLYKNK